METAHQLFARQAGSQGSATDSTNTSSSASALLSALIPSLIVSAAFFVAFILLRPIFQRIYEPRSYLGRFRDYEKTPAPKTTKFGWISDFRSLPDTYILNHQSLDGYLYVRYVKLCTLICFVGALVTWPILFPVNATAPTPPGQSAPTQFDVLSFAASAGSPNRYYAHAFLAWIFFGGVVFIAGRESMFALHLQQAYLRSPLIASRMSSRTVIYTDVPNELMDEAALRDIFPNIKHVWLATDTKELEELVKERDKTVMKLEGAEIKLSKAANQQRLKMQKKNKPFDDPIAWVDENKRPTHKLKPLIGKKVDTINWCREHLTELIPKVEQQQADHWNGKAKTINACFIEFETIQAAESAYWITGKENKMMERASRMRPDEVIWGNLGKKKSQRTIVHAVAVGLVTALIIFWIPFVAFVGALTNLPSLTNKVPFLSFILDIPGPLLGIVTGLIPVILLSVLLAIVPIFFRSNVELEVHSWYYWFMVIIGFLITTLSSSATSVVTEIIQNPSSAKTLLASNLPKAANFYNSFVLAKAVAGVGGMFLAIAGVAVFIILKSLLMKTPRKRYNQYMKIGGYGWGSTYPATELFIVIAFAYAIIAPLILGFSAIGIGLYYIAYRYIVMYRLDTSQIGTYGANYLRAMQHFFSASYIALIALIGLLIIESTAYPAAVGPLVITVLLLVFVIVSHVLINMTLKIFKQNLTGYTVGSDKEPGSISSGSNGLFGGGADLYANSEIVLSTSQNVPGIKGFVLKLIRPKTLPGFASHFSSPAGDYSSDVRREAYLDPAITSPTPILWIVHDEMGVSAREKELSGKVLGTTDQGAFWNPKGKLTTVWEDQPIEKQNELVTTAPIYEEKPRL